MVTIFIPGEPEGKARARTFYDPQIQRHKSVTPERTVLYENLIRELWLNESKGEFYDGDPLMVIITASFLPPKSASKRKRAEMLEGKIQPTKKPDIDNILKVVLDALNGLAYRDDSQVVCCTVLKTYGEEEGVYVSVGKFENYEITFASLGKYENDEI